MRASYAALAEPNRPGVPLRPNQLPRERERIIGRDIELARLAEIAKDPRSANGPIVAVIEGMAGVGKTALAISAAHRLTELFPDGQLFINLHGFTDQQPVKPVEALGEFLRAIGVPGDQIPSGLDAIAALWRSWLAERRVLIVLDNVADLNQLMPLLPGDHGCMVISTSRRRLLGIDTTITISLDLLSPSASLDLLTNESGHKVTEDTLPSLKEVVDRCGRLPLAISISGATLKTRSTWTAADLAKHLGETTDRVFELSDGYRSVGKVLQMSYDNLSSSEKRLYRLLGLHPGYDFDPWAAAAVAGTTVARVAEDLQRLRMLHLLTEQSKDRYGSHDLIRTHAYRLSLTHDSASDRASALRRLLTYYTQTATSAMEITYPFLSVRKAHGAPDTVSRPPLGGIKDATGWLDTEVTNLLAVATFAATHGHSEFSAQLSTTLHRHLRTRGRYNDAAELHRQGLAAARSLGDRAYESAALSELGWAYLRQGNHKAAVQSYQEALRVPTSSTASAKLEAQMGLGDTFYTTGDHDAARRYYTQAQQTAQRSDNRAGEAEALANIGWCDFTDGEFRQAHESFSAALQFAKERTYDIGEVKALLGLGRNYQVQGEFLEADDCIHQALDRARSIGHRTSEANALLNLARVRLAKRDYLAALELFDSARHLALSAGHRIILVCALNGLGHLNRQQRKDGAALKCYMDAYRIAKELYEVWEIEAYIGLGRLSLSRREAGFAEFYFRHALAIASACRRPVDQLFAYNGLASALTISGQSEMARQHWRSALAILKGLDAARVTAYHDERTTRIEIQAQLELGSYRV